MHGYAALMGPSALATKEFVVHQQPDAEGRYVRIVGRPSGLFDWVLSLMGIDTTTVFEVYADHVRFKTSNLSGSQTTVIPLSAVSSTSAGYFKPFIYLVLGVILIPVLIGIVLIIYYFLHKSLMISVQAHSSNLAMIAFKRSVIEGIKVEEHHANQVVQMINTLVLRHNRNA